MLSINTEFLANYINEHEYVQLEEYAQLAHNNLMNKKGAGSDFHGWVDLPKTIDQDELRAIEETAKRVQEKYDAFVCIGIGGSYLGHKSIIEALSPAVGPKTETEILYAAHNLSPRYLEELLTYLEDKDYCVNVIAKEGIAIETAITFRIFRDVLSARFGVEGAKERIIVTTDQYRGPLKDIVAEHGYTMFHLPHEVGGRFSVFTPVGLLPIAVAGYDIRALMSGARTMMETCQAPSILDNPAMKYATIRTILERKGKQIELFVAYEPHLTYFSEWLKQLFGESDGKDGKGLFPASVLYSTDLHSLGQMIQEGQKNIFETTLTFNQTFNDVSIPSLNENLDNIEFLSNKPLSHIQASIKSASMLAHSNGGVPNLEVNVNKLDEYHLGALMYFFMMSTAIGGYLAGRNPFDQNGVDMYKAEMMKILRS